LTVLHALLIYLTDYRLLQAIRYAADFATQMESNRCERCRAFVASLDGAMEFIGEGQPEVLLIASKVNAVVYGATPEVGKT
jgi:hypothetical protein